MSLGARSHDPRHTATIDTAWGQLGDDWPTILAIATNQPPDEWLEIAAARRAFPSDAAQAVYFVEGVLRGLEEAQLTTPPNPIAVSSHCCPNVQRIAVVILAEIADRIRPL